MMTIKGRLLLSIPVVEWFLATNFLSLLFGGIKRGSVLISTFKPPKGISLRDNLSFEPLHVKICSGIWPVRELKKKKYI